MQPILISIDDDESTSVVVSSQESNASNQSTSYQHSSSPSTSAFVNESQTIAISSPHCTMINESTIDSSMEYDRYLIDEVFPSIECIAQEQCNMDTPIAYGSVDGDKDTFALITSKRLIDRIKCANILQVLL